MLTERQERFTNQYLLQIRNEHLATTALTEDVIIDCLSKKIREHRFRNGEMTQKELAERVGVSRQTMTAIENCRHAPTVAVAIRIADVFCVSVNQLFELDNDGKPDRREQASSVSLHRSQATIEKSIEIEDRREPLEEESTREFSMVDLRNVF